MEFFLKIGFSPLQILMLKEQGGKYKLSWQCVAGIACGAIFSGGGDLLCAETKVGETQFNDSSTPFRGLILVDEKKNSLKGIKSEQKLIKAI